jgi:transposase
VIKSKYAELTPLFRQAEIYSRQGVEINRSLCGFEFPVATTAGIGVDEELHADDMPVYCDAKMLRYI